MFGFMVEWWNCQDEMVVRRAGCAAMVGGWEWRCQYLWRRERQ